MPAFVSLDGKLSMPAAPHADDGKYSPIEIGRPVCIEIIHMAFGDIKDWWGKSEIMVSSWAKTGGVAKSGVRMLNIMRKEIPKYYHLSDLGAAEYGHQLIYYTPAYGGEAIRFSVEFLEIDKLGKDGISKLGNALRNLGGAPLFAPQLSYLSALPEVLELGRKLYNIFNHNDVILLEHLDLSKDPDSNILTSGRYVLVSGNYNPIIFGQKYRLEADNRLYTIDGKLAEEAGMKNPYIVIRINAVEKNEYRNFENDSSAQEILDAVLNQGASDSIADLISETVKTARQYGSIKKVLETKKLLDKESDETRKATFKTTIEREMKLLNDEQSSLIKDVLNI